MGISPSLFIITLAILGETKTKGEERRDFFLLIETVTDEQPFSIVHFAVFAGKVEVGGSILQTQREDLRKFSCALP
ncbi:MAG: hypothetical protein NVSMB49_22970 [Ktedonobacteraceae bacterium]